MCTSLAHPYDVGPSDNMSHNFSQRDHWCDYRKSPTSLFITRPFPTVPFLCPFSPQLPPLILHPPPLSPHPPIPLPPLLQVRKDYKQMVGDYKSLASKAKKIALHITWPLLQPLASGICSMRPHVLGTFSHTALFLRPDRHNNNNKLTSGVCSKKKIHFYVLYNDEQ